MGWSKLVTVRKPWPATACALGVGLALVNHQAPSSLQAEPLGRVRRVNVPYLGPSPPAADFVPAIFWFGDVGMTNNYADVRVWYYDGYLKFVLHIPDRVLWNDQQPSSLTLTDWDAVSVYLDLSGNTGESPTEDSYTFVGQLGNTGAANSKAAFKGTGSGWALATTAFTASNTWRGNYPNDDVWDVGWQATFEIPFSSLGFSSPPTSGTTWGLGVVVHDRDDQAGTPIADQFWPETFDGLRPATWGQLRFGRPVYTPPTAEVAGSTVVQHGFNGSVVPDAAVGGHTICGGTMNAWTEWGDANYAGYAQFNIQNQWDVSDFMCFSKYYVTFPLTSLPPNVSIVGAKVTLRLFGNAGYGNATPSAINVLTVAEDWLESSITWNSAPYAAENISVAWVYPVSSSHPRGPYEWDVSYAVAEAIRDGQPLRLVFYSTDGDYHSGKYFWTSDSDDWGGTFRPALTVDWGVADTQPPSSPTGLRVGP